MPNANFSMPEGKPPVASRPKSETDITTVPWSKSPASAKPSTVSSKKSWLWPKTRPCEEIAWLCSPSCFANSRRSQTFPKSAPTRSERTSGGHVLGGAPVEVLDHDPLYVDEVNAIRKSKRSVASSVGRIPVDAPTTHTTLQ